MKKLILLLVVFLAVLLVGNVWAADLKGKFGITGKGGVAIPLGDFSASDKLAAKTGYGFGITGEYYINNAISIGAGFLYDVHGVKDVPPGMDLKWKILNYGAFFKYHFPTASKVLPYVKFDLGFYQPKGTISVGSTEASATFSTKIGIAGGGGIGYQVSPNIILGGELMLHNAFTSSATWEGIKLDSDLQYVSIFAGVTFLVGGIKY
jgi:opacity protein-like surface antigen